MVKLLHFYPPKLQLALINLVPIKPRLTLLYLLFLVPLYFLLELVLREIFLLLQYSVCFHFTNQLQIPSTIHFLILFFQLFIPHFQLIFFLLIQLFLLEILPIFMANLLFLTFIVMVHLSLPFVPHYFSNFLPVCLPKLPKRLLYSKEYAVFELNLEISNHSKH